MLAKALKNFIEKTERETLSYKIFQNLKYRIGKLLNIKNLLMRKRRIASILTQTESSELKIQFGGGSGQYNEAIITTIDGFIDSDIFGYLPIDVTKKLPLPSNSIDTIFSSHLIEHLHQKEIEKYLSECHRILKHDGKIITAAPSFEKICKLVYGPNDQRKKEYLELHGRSLLGKMPTPARVLNCVSHINYGHKYLLDFETYHDLASTSGFSETRVLEPKDVEDIGLIKYFSLRKDTYWLETEIWSSKKLV